MKSSVDFEYEAKLLNLREVIQNLVCEKCFGRYSGSHPNENIVRYIRLNLKYEFFYEKNVNWIEIFVISFQRELR